ncbi:MAG: hypothetical protein HQL40_20250 [Alphaproteobacteria bacterium]|nr:hypothetical protein [Alphaproteobacteria bacterium]
MGNVLGLGFGHDAAAAVVKDGKLSCAVAKERLDRKKKSSGISRELIDYVLDASDLRLDQIDLIITWGYTRDPKHDDSQYPILVLDDGSKPDFFMPPEYGEGTFLFPQHGVEKPAVFINHQLAHCAAAYYTSPFEQAACFSVDASGQPAITSLFAFGHAGHTGSLFCPGVMVGCTYGHFTEWLGLGSQVTKAGTLMGLAPYGTVKPAARELLGLFKESVFNRSILPAQGIMQYAHLPFDRLVWGQIADVPPYLAFDKTVSDTPRAMDIAASIQFVFEEVMVHWANVLWEHTKVYNDGNLCLSGGSFLNCDANSAILTRTPFRKVHLFPGCSDDGAAVGAAFWGAHVRLRDPRIPHSGAEIVYTGRSYPAPRLGEPLDIDVVARCIAEGGIVAWYQGRSEFGPRALGNRSILADPRRADMRHVINTRVKRREWFRPFAPAVLYERTRDWFDFEGESKYMLFKAQVKRPHEIPAVTHVDNSARVQTVIRADNPRYYDLIAAFERLTGVPVLLNTSLNVNEEPLCETPEDAIRFFERADPALVRILVLEDRMVRR